LQPIINEATAINLGASDYYTNNNLEPDNEYLSMPSLYCRA